MATGRLHLDTFKMLKYESSKLTEPLLCKGNKLELPCGLLCVVSLEGYILRWNLFIVYLNISGMSRKFETSVCMYFINLLNTT